MYRLEQHRWCCRYLATGDDACSLTLVVEKVSEHDVVCKAQNDCAFSADDLLHVHIANMQNELPILGEADRATLAAIGPICPDFLMLSCTRSEQDILDARTFLNEYVLHSDFVTKTKSNILCIF